MGMTMASMSAFIVMVCALYGVSGGPLHDAFETARFRRGIGVKSNKIWPGGVIPYILNVRNDVKSKILSGFREWERVTCVKFRPANTARDRNIVMVWHGKKGWNKDGCSSALGRTGGRVQHMTLGASGCINWRHTLLHEIGHTIGLAHEHQHWNRDSGIYIHYNNIPQKDRVWYNKLSQSQYSDYGVGYDLRSIMHYRKTYGSKLYIQTRDPKMQDIIGNLQTLSSKDIETVNRMYNCRRG